MVGLLRFFGVGELWVWILVGDDGFDVVGGVWVE